MESKQVLVLGASRYNFTNRETGELVKGTKVHYVDLDSDNNSDSAGLLPLSCNIAYEEFASLKTFPGYYKMNLTIDFTKKQPKVKVKGFELLTPAQLS